MSDWQSRLNEDIKRQTAQVKQQDAERNAKRTNFGVGRYNNNPKEHLDAFLKWAKSNYSGYNWDKYSKGTRSKTKADPDSVLQTVKDQFDYNYDRREAGKDELKYGDATYNPLVGNDSTKNEARSDFIKQYKRTPSQTEQDAYTQKYIQTQDEAKRKERANLLGVTYKPGQNVSGSRDWQERGYTYNAADPKDTLRRKLGLPPQSYLDLYDGSDDEGKERKRTGQKPKALQAEDDAKAAVDAQTNQQYAIAAIARQNAERQQAEADERRANSAATRIRNEGLLGGLVKVPDAVPDWALNTADTWGKVLHWTPSGLVRDYVLPAAGVAVRNGANALADLSQGKQPQWQGKFTDKGIEGAPEATDILRNTMAAYQKQGKPLPIFENRQQQSDFMSWLDNNPAAKTVLNFVGDAAIDPTSYVGAGEIASLAKAAKGLKGVPAVGKAAKATSALDDIASAARDASAAAKTLDSVSPVKTTKPVPSALKNAPKRSTVAMAENAAGDTLTASADDLRRSTMKGGTPETQLKTPIPEGLKERGYSETIRTREDIPQAVKDEFAVNPSFYKQLSNKTTDEAAAQIMAQGVDTARPYFDRLLSEKSPVAVALGKKLAREYSAAGDTKSAVDVLQNMAQKLTESGQFSQAAAIGLMKEDPATALQYLQRNINRMNAAGAEKFKGKWNDFQLDDGDIKDLMSVRPGDEDAIKKVFERVGQKIGRFYPASLWEKFVELGRVGMLLNPKTQMRNVFGNALMLPINTAARKTSAVIQQTGAVAARIMGKEFKPTQALLVGKDARALARRAFDANKDALINVNKWDEAVQTGIKGKEVFKKSKWSIATNAVNKLLPAGKKLDKPLTEYVRQLTYKLLDIGDKPFLQKAYEDRLASYIQARKIARYDDIPREAFDIATEEALKATFKDTNALSTMLSSIKNNKSAALRKAGEAILPFTKTPANIAMRTVDYSPAGIATAFRYAGNGGAAKVIDNLSKGLVGSAGILLGVYLRHLGYISGDKPDDKDMAAFDKQSGKYPYTIKLPGGYSYTYDWAMPAAADLIIGSSIYDTLMNDEKKAANEESTPAQAGFKAAIDAGYALGDSLLSMSPLQSLAELAQSSGSFTERTLKTVAQMPQRLIPSALAGFNRVLDPTQRLTYDPKDWLATQANQVKSKLPGASRSLAPAIDIWGRTVTRDPNTAARAFNELLSPGKLSQDKSTELDTEIMRLYKSTGDATVFPRMAGYSFRADNEKYQLNPQELSRFQKTQGSYAYSELTKLFASTAYRDAKTDADKAKLVTNIINNSTAKAKNEYLTDLYAMKGQLYTGMLTPSQEVRFKHAVEKSNVNPATVLDVYLRMPKSENTSNSEKNVFIHSQSGLTSDQMTAIYEALVTWNPPKN